MSKDCSTSVPGISLQGRFPNEISDLIVGYLVDDLPSLRNVALLCHDFANLARSHIFGQVDLKDVSNGTGYFPSKSRSSGHRRDDYLPLMYRFAALLNDPKTAFLGRFVRRLNFDPCSGPLRNVEQAELDLIISSVFQQLPLLIELSVNRGRLVHLAAAQMYLSQQLKVLTIGHMVFHDHNGFEQLQDLLTSLTNLTFLTIHDWSLGRPLHIGTTSARALILPSSLKKACFTGTDEDTLKALGLGLKSPQAPVLSSFFSDFRNEVEDRSTLWTGIGSHAVVVLDVGNTMYWPGNLTTWKSADPIASYIPAMVSVTRGLICSELTLYCSQLYHLIAYFAHFVSVLPEAIRRICIDFNAGASDGPLDRDLDSWVKLDSALMNRHALGLLENVCFRCTKRTMPGNGPSFERGKCLDRGILDRIPALLHHSKEVGVLEVDHATVVFEL
ncbi:hypothetical protein DFH05DRAFT_1527263 [Lentinula detonsa]|uniref:Uncharacterized protein n=1 Tax=Lentinula detonsa TaxID=2804962 RepID=A0A9W8NXA2_9AGAR|nr:hypothetical protein DFH05DRAFT_1527263 [Lentinula detonsa]